MGAVSFANRDIQSISDLDRLISDIYNVLGIALAAKAHLSDQGIDYSASKQTSDDMKCIIPFFDYPLAVAAGT